jgi:hypothetical protein
MSNYELAGPFDTYNNYGKGTSVSEFLSTLPEEYKQEYEKCQYKVLYDFNEDKLYVRYPSGSN